MLIIILNSIIIFLFIIIIIIAIITITKAIIIIIFKEIFNPALTYYALLINSKEERINNMLSKVERSFVSYVKLNVS